MLAGIILRVCWKKEVFEGQPEGQNGGELFLSPNNTLITAHSGSTILMECKLSPGSKFQVVSSNKKYT